jgi:hypothetical protein
MNFKCFSVLPLMAPLLSSWEPMNGSRLLTGEYNKTLVLWRELMLARVPMLKVQLLRERLSGEPPENVLFFWISIHRVQCVRFALTSRKCIMAKPL